MSRPTTETQKAENTTDGRPRVPMLHRVRNHAEHNFEQGKSVVRKIAGTEDIHSASAIPWIVIPRAGIRTVEETNARTGKTEKVRRMTPGEVVLDDEMLDFLRKSPVCSAWLKPDPVSGSKQVEVIESYPASSP